LKTRAHVAIASIVQSRLHSLRARVGLSASVDEVAKLGSELVDVGARIYAASHAGIYAACRELFKMISVAPPSLTPSDIERLYKRYEESLKRVLRKIIQIESVEEAKRVVKSALDSFIEALSDLRSEWSAEVAKQIDRIVNALSELSKRVEEARNLDELVRVVHDIEKLVEDMLDELVPALETLLHVAYALYIATRSIQAKILAAALYTLRNLFRARISNVEPLDAVRGLACLLTSTSITLASLGAGYASPELYSYVAAYSLWSQAFANAFAACERCSWIDVDRVLDLFERRSIDESARLLDIAMFSDIGLECFRHLFSMLRVDLTRSLEEIREEERAAVLQREAEGNAKED